MPNKPKPADKLARLREKAAQARASQDWTGALQAYAQGLDLSDLALEDRIDFHQGRAACFRALERPKSEAEELRLANQLYQKQVATLLEENRQRNAELAVINSIQDGLAAKLDVPSIFELVGLQISEIFSGHNVGLYTYDPDTDMGEAMYILEKGHRYYPPPFRPGPIGRRAIETGKPLMISSRKEYEEIGAITVEGTEPSQSGIYAPLMVNGRMIGALNIENSEKAYAFTKTDLRLLTTVANAVSVALENARLFDETQRLLEESKQRSSELQIINNVQAGLAARLDMREIYDLVGNQVKEIFDAEVVVINRFDMDNRLTFYEYSVEKGQRLPVEPQPFTPIIEEFIKNKRTFLVNEGFADLMKSAGTPAVVAGETPLSLLAVPLLSKGNAVGAISLQNVSKEHAFKSSDVQLLETLAASLSVALETARLFDETQNLLRETEQRAGELEIINSVLTGLASKLDMQAIYDLVGDKICEITGSEIVVIQTWDKATGMTRFDYAREKGVRSKVIERQMTPLNWQVIPDIESGNTIVWNDGMEERLKKYNHSLPFGEMPLSVIIVPLKTGDRINTSISLQNTQRENAFDQSTIRLVETLAGSMGIALENARLFDETQRLLKETEQRAGELAIINSIQSGLASEMDFQGIVDLVGDRLQEVLQIDNVSIIWVDYERMMAVPLYVSIDGERIQQEPWEPGEAGKNLLKNRQPIIWQTAIQANEMGLWTREGDKEALSGIFMPIIGSDTVIGVIRLEHYEQEYAFDESVVRLINTIASSMGVALENARLFNETQRLLSETAQRAAELAAINRVSDELVAEPNLEVLIQVVGEQLRQIFNADIAYVALLDQDRRLINFPYQYGETFSTLPLGEGLTSKIIESGEPLLINQDVEQRRAALGATLVGRQSRSYLGVPIILGKQPIGVISVQSTQTEGLYSENDVRLLSTIAANVSTAIRNANLFNEINNQKNYYETIIANSPAAIVVLDEDMHVTGWNPAAEQLFGYTQEEALGRNVDTLVTNRPDIYAETNATSHLVVLKGGAHIISKRARKDGSLVDVELMALPVTVEGRQSGYIAIYHDITELQRARQEAIEANQAKSTFLANMSHELRTPLNAIIGFTRIVRRKGEGLLPQKQLDNLDKVLVSSDHLLGLINTVLDIAKIEAGRMDVQASSFQIEPLINLVASTTQPLIRQEKVSLQTEIQPDIPVLHTDQEKLKQILLNLLSNAAKFTHEGSITLSAGAEPERLVVSVADTGIGISPEALNRVFEEFQQADTSTTREYGGTGLGLSISRSLAQLLGGSLKAASQEGVGTTFTLTIPLVYSARPPEPASTVSQEVPARPERGCDDLVLVIDDQPEAIELVREILMDAGYRVIGAQDGTQGLKLAREIQPVAVTLDVMMPSKDGWQVLHDLKTDPLTRPIPVVLVSIVDQKVLGYRLGADDYLVKPLNGDELLASLERLTGKRSRSRLLVVDDDPNVADLIRQMLEDSPYQVEAAEDGLQALSSFQAALPDIILLDLLMPNLDGFGVIEKLRQQPETRRIPVIVLTAKSLTHQETAILNEGIYSILQKQGLQGEELIKQIEGALLKARE